LEPDSRRRLGRGGSAERLQCDEIGSPGGEAVERQQLDVVPIGNDRSAPISTRI
jgi:hypothetical protein